MRGTLKKLLPNLLSLLAILVVVFLGFRVLTFASFTMKWDMMNQFLPCRFFISDCLRHKIFPLWCPYINFGYPFYADPQSGLFYPVTWIIAGTVGYNATTIGFEYLLHVAIAAIAFFYLLKNFELDNYTSTVFAIIYCMSGVFVSNAQHLPWIITMAWLPLIFLNFKNIFEKRNRTSVAGLALFMYLAITGGYPGFFIILFYFFLVYGLLKTGGALRAEGLSSFLSLVMLFGFVAVIFALFTGGYLFSFIHSLPFIARGKPVSLHEANNVSVTPHSLVSFFFPFATACSAFKLDTDISMANIYCGFLLLPLIVIAFFKTRLRFFHQSIVLLALICFLAALGKYFYVRTWLYNYLPGMNMLRHAAIFRVFTVFGLIFIAAFGFAGLLNAIKTKTAGPLARRVFIPYLFLLLAMFFVALFKNGFHLTAVNIFNEAVIANFNRQNGVYAHIVAQLLFQLPLLLAFISLLFLERITPSVKVLMLSIIAVTEIFISVQLNLPATVISDVRPADLQAKLDSFSKGYPVPPLSPMDNFTHFSDGSTMPIYYNLSFFKKIPAKDGFNSFYLQQVDDFANSSTYQSVLKKPVVFFNRSTTNFEIKKFEPGCVIIQYAADTPDIIHLQQNYYAGWTVFVDSLRKMPDHELCVMNSTVPTGKHIVRFEYHQRIVKYLLLLSMLSAGLISLLLIAAQIRKQLV